jgi:predicted membrane channel-forming protein YqfA (hemolysin III family)
MMSGTRQSRPVEKSILWYMLSLFKWHADTLNAWSHIAGFFIFTYFFFLSPLLVSNYTLNDDDYEDNLLSIRVFTLCISLMYASSVLFHVFWPFSEKVCRKCERLEYCCSVLAIVGTGFPLTLLTFARKAFFKPMSLAGK